MLYVLLGVVLVAFVGSVVGVRMLGHDIEQWHVDPVTAPKPSTPNSYRAGDGPAALFDRDVPVYSVDPATLSAAWDRMIQNQPRVEVLADDRLPGEGSNRVMEGIVTYVQRSAVFGFPDYISVRFVAAGRSDDGQLASTLVVFSRSRLGQSDLGVNGKRVNAWLDALDAELN